MCFEKLREPSAAIPYNPEESNSISLKPRYQGTCQERESSAFGRGRSKSQMHREEPRGLTRRPERLKRVINGSGNIRGSQARNIRAPNTRFGAFIDQQDWIPARLVDTRVLEARESEQAQILIYEQPPPCSARKMARETTSPVVAIG